MSDPLPILASVGILWLTFLTLRGGFAIKPGQTVTNFSGSALGLAVASIVIAGVIFGWVAGLILVIGIAIHEFGHVAAFRAAGHTDARFRLIPLMGGVAISSKLPKDQLTDFYIAFMGPGIMLAIVVISGAMVSVFAPDNPLAAGIAFAVFSITGAINFFNLLPLWPLDGGRILRTITYPISPLASRYITLAMSIGLAICALYIRAPLIFIVAILGFSSARRIAVINRAQAPMSKSQAIIATTAYIAALVAHGMAGWSMIQRFLVQP